LHPSNWGGTVPAITSTAYAGEIDQQQAFAADLQRHITQPGEPEQWVEAIALVDPKPHRPT
jgi:CheY-like chemotaxis protein